MSTAKQSFGQEAARIIEMAKGLHGNTKIAQTAKVLKEGISVANEEEYADFETFLGNKDGLGDFIQCPEGADPDCFGEVSDIGQGLICADNNNFDGGLMDTVADENDTDLSIAEPDPSLEMG